MKQGFESCLLQARGHLSKLSIFFNTVRFGA